MKGIERAESAVGGGVILSSCARGSAMATCLFHTGQWMGGSKGEAKRKRTGLMRNETIITSTTAEGLGLTLARKGSESLIDSLKY